MPLSKFDGLKLPATVDCHVHLRDGEMMKVSGLESYPHMELPRKSYKKNQHL